MLSWILRLIPADYKWSVGIKKASYTVGKLAVSALMYGKIGHYVGSHLTPDQLNEVQMAAAGLTAAGLEGFHDWAKLKWPDAKWL